MDLPWHKYTSLRRRQQRLSTAKASETPGLLSWAAGSGSGSVFTFRDLVHPEAADKRFRVLISQANRVLAYREQRSNTGRYPVQCAGQRSSTRVGRGWRVMVGGHHGPVCMDSGRRVQRITPFGCNFCCSAAGCYWAAKYSKVVFQRV